MPQVHLQPGVLCDPQDYDLASRFPACTPAAGYTDHEVSVQSLSFSGSFWVEPAAASPHLALSADLLRMSSALRSGC